MCFLLGTPSRDFGFCFWCRSIILRCSSTPDKPALVAGCGGRPRIPTGGRALPAAGALRSGAGGPRRALAGVPAVAWAPHGGRTPQTRRRRPRARQLAGGRDSFPNPYLSLKLLFFFNLMTGTKVTGKSFVQAKGGHKPGHFTAFVTEYLPCWSLTLPFGRTPRTSEREGDLPTRRADGPTGLRTRRAARVREGTGAGAGGDGPTLSHCGGPGALSERCDQ